MWAYRPTPKHSTSLSPFHLAFGSEAVLPTEIMMPTSRIKAAVQSDHKDQILQNDQNLLDKTRLEAVQHNLKYQEDMKRRYDNSKFSN